MDFPNKGYVMVEDQKVLVKTECLVRRSALLFRKNVQEELRAVFWRYWKITSGKREPVCSSFPQCGGCMYQTMPYEEQLHMKERQIRELLEEVLVKEGQTDLNGKADFVWEGIHGSPEEFCYRNKMEFSFGDEYKDGPLSLGLHKKEVPMMC